ncbi:ATP-binding protein [Botrimarina sp.]|uniref:ATP-binding protein n=1 Tax=Botrimarina sp. TaxID=2795802 RepID=UPI0032EEBFA5
MNPLANPYSPGAGAPPRELVGRDPILQQAEVLLHRVKQGRPEKSLLLTGLRGVGKTVLLNEIARRAVPIGYQTAEIEATESRSLAESIAPALRKLLFTLDRLEGAGNAVRRGMAVLKSFLDGFRVEVGEVTVGLDIDPEKGSADSGDLEADLPELIVAVAQAAASRGQAVAVLIDEVQYFNSTELSSLIMAMHKVQQRQLPLVLIGAGLPILPGLAGESKSYAERLFGFPDIGALNQAEAAAALRGPAESEGVGFEDRALEEVFRVTNGYPYFVQEWGYQAWNTAECEPISVAVIKASTHTAIERLDQNFFRVRFDRCTNGEKNVLRIMAELGPGPHRIGDVADKKGVKVTSLGPVRAKLIRKGMIYSPGHGELGFTVPLFDDFMRRAIPDCP